MEDDGNSFHSLSTETLSDEEFHSFDDDSSFRSEMSVQGCRYLTVKIEEGNEMALTGMHENNWRTVTDTPLHFLLQQLRMSQNEREWRCIAGSFPLWTYETNVLGRYCAWKSGDIDIFHVCTYTDFLWHSFYPFIVRLWEHGFNVIIYSAQRPPQGERVSPMMLMGYALQGIQEDADMYHNLPIDALFDVDVSSLTDEVDNFSFILKTNAEVTDDIINTFDINICQIQMIWNEQELHTLYAPMSIQDDIIARNMRVTYTITEQEDDTQNMRRTQQRRRKYEHRGYNTIGIAYRHT